MIPARQSVRDSGVLDGTAQEPIAKQIDSMRFLPAVPGIGTVQAETLEVAVANVVLGEAEVEPALRKATETANKMIADNEASFGK